MPEGWRPLPRSHPKYSPTKRLYLDPQNRIVSRRAYDNARLQSLGWESKADFDSRFTARKDRGYNRWAEVAAENLDIDLAELTRADGEFNAMFLAARDDGWSNDPDGTFADFLVYIGLRQQGAEYDIGDSP